MSSSPGAPRGLKPSTAGLPRALLHAPHLSTELFATEGSHLRILRVLDLLFYQRMKKENLLSREELALLFPNLPDLIEIHSKALPTGILPQNTPRSGSRGWPMVASSLSPSTLLTPSYPLTLQLLLPLSWADPEPGVFRAMPMLVLGTPDLCPPLSTGHLQDPFCCPSTVTAEVKAHPSPSHPWDRQLATKAVMLVPR